MIFSQFMTCELTVPGTYLEERQQLRAAGGNQKKVSMEVCG